jgi:hypothetical protein
MSRREDDQWKVAAVAAIGLAMGRRDFADAGINAMNLVCCAPPPPSACTGLVSACTAWPASAARLPPAFG